MWQWQDDKSLIVPKLSYVQAEQMRSYEEELTTIVEGKEAAGNGQAHL